MKLQNTSDPPIDSYQPTDLGNLRLRNLTSAWGPLYVRYCGTTGNSLWFHDSDAPPPPRAANPACR